MKIAIMSDLHVEFDGVVGYGWHRPEAAVHINAGDLHPDPGRRAAASNSFDINVMGNHDYYGGSFPEVDADFGIFEKDGVKFAWATLWTKIETDDQWYFYNRGLVDSHYIKGLTQERYNAKFKHDLVFLRESEADVIVTHHSPFIESCHPKWRESVLNFAFHSDLSHYVGTEFKKIPKLWIHGHTHDPSDYVLPYGTRVICHPRGYPGEVNHKGYKPKVIDL